MALVPGICWYEDRKGEAHCLPAQTVVPGAVALAPNGLLGTYLDLALPAGTVDLDGGIFPVQPVPVDRVFPLRSADIPWQPERPQHGVVDLGQDWRMLFRERAAFAPWGAAAAPFALAMREYLRAHGPRATFRAGADRRTMRYIFPQVVPPTACYRLARSYADLPARERYAAVVAEGERTLRGPDGWSATAGTDPIGWRVVVRRADADPETARSAEAGIELLSAKGPIWEVVPAPPRLRALVRSH